MGASQKVHTKHGSTRDVLRQTHIPPPHSEDITGGGGGGLCKGLAANSHSCTFISAINLPDVSLEEKYCPKLF